MVRDPFHRFQAVGHGRHVVPGPREAPAEEMTQGFVVFGEQDAGHGRVPVIMRRDCGARPRLVENS